MEKLAGLTTIIMAGGRGERLYPLTRDRAKPAITFGGSYRIIDFTLSNCLNSGIRRIYVLTQYGSFSLDQHLRLAWNIMPGELGEFIWSIPPQQITVNRWYRGTADSIYQNLRLLQEERPTHVLILSGDHVYKMNYLEMLNFHLERDADLTVAAVMVPRRDATSLGVLKVDAYSRVVDFLEKPAEPPGLPENPDFSLGSMGVYIFRAENLVKEVILDAKRPDSGYDFGKNIIPAMINKSKVFGFNFQAPGSSAPLYWRDIGQLDAYFEAHLDLLSASPAFDLHDPAWPIRGYVRGQAPAKYISGAAPVAIADSLIACGSIIEGASISRAVLSPEVKVHRGAAVEEAILWDRVEIGARAKIRRAIIEDGVRIPPGFTIGYDPDADRSRFPVSEAGVVVVPSNVILED